MIGEAWRLHRNFALSQVASQAYGRSAEVILGQAREGFQERCPPHGGFVAEEKVAIFSYGRCRPLCHEHFATL